MENQPIRPFVQPIIINKNILLAPSTSSSTQNDQFASLSPAINFNQNNFIESINNTNSCNSTSSSTSSTTTISKKTLPINKSAIEDDLKELNRTEEKPQTKQFQKIGNYILNDTQSAESFNLAFNSLEHKCYFWKKFLGNKCQDKLQAYFIMDGCSDLIYRYKEIIKSQNEVYVFFDAHFGDLHSYMKDKKRLKETEAKQLFYQIVQVVNECHANGIIVRDIKLKKFVFANSERTKILLTNLEDCLVLEKPENDFIKSQQGCPAYVSPEVLNPTQACYSGKASDAWSLGIVMYTLLFGRYPFHHNVITTMFAKITKGKFQIPTSGISLNAKILLRSLIRLKPEERLMPNEILQQNWFKDTQFNEFCNNNDCFHYKPINEQSKTKNDNSNININNNSEKTNEFFNNFENNINSTFSSPVLANSKSAKKNNINQIDDDQFVPNFNEEE